MPRSNAVNQSEFPYSVGARCINKEWFKLPMSVVWEVMSEQLYFTKFAFNLEIHSFVLMSNHFHLLVSTPDANLSEAMSWFMRETSRELNRLGNRINRTYAGRYFRCVVDSHHYFLHAYKYIYLNPVKVGMVSRAEDYPYSTLRAKLGQRAAIVSVEEDLTLFSDISGTLGWLNSMPSDYEWEKVGFALRRPQFALSKCRQTRKASRLENERL